ncbi:ABC transporter permease [Jiangella alba]|uniref:Peptide/nickel transport system permease protein n=1 Tax=Jiangella alba TaxID=561176 RepID=A0A1H5L6M5_9ACTN|nr:ABC transporter permease [Jiangella alba]SEE72227.1 peptide/nickel transport system permease protein [Jiangella alba]
MRSSFRARHPWLVFLTRRLGRFVVSMAVVVTAAFAMVHALPGDPVRAALGLRASPETISATREKLGLDDPLWQQYVDYLRGLLHLDLGTSLDSQTPVREIMAQLVPATVKLGLTAFVVCIVIAIPVGLLIGIATRDGRGRTVHLGFGGLTGLALSVPDYLLSVGLVFVFSVSLGALPVAGMTGAASFVLPVIALVVGPGAYLARIVRAETQGVLSEDYIRTARAKRLPARVVYLRHALPNTLTPTLTVCGMILASMLAGTVLVESVFAWPGIGAELVDSVLVKDYPMVQAVALFFGAGILLINLVVDVAIAAFDPRSTIKES